jgi:hypothetical protein
MGWWSVFGKPKARKASKPGTPAHEDLVRRNFTATAPNTVWVADLTEHRTAQGKLDLCAIKDLFSNRIVGWAIDSRMKARLVVAAIEMAVARRDGEVAGCILHSDRGSPFRARKVHRALARHGLVGSMGQVGSAGDNAAMGIVLRPPPTQRLGPTPLDHARPAPHRDRHLDRTHLPPAPSPTGARPIDPHRIRNDHHHTGHRGRLAQPVTSARGSPDRARTSASSSRRSVLRVPACLAAPCGTLVRGVLARESAGKAQGGRSLDGNLYECLD